MATSRRLAIAECVHRWSVVHVARNRRVTFERKGIDDASSTTRQSRRDFP
jgi:hypothetical protein